MDENQLVEILHSDDENDVQLGIAIFNEYFYNKNKDLKYIRQQFKNRKKWRNIVGWEFKFKLKEKEYYIWLM